MRDPHVLALTYGLVTDATTIYKDPPPVAFLTALARFELKDGVLTVTMNEHFASAADARKAVAGVLQAWELRTELVSSAGRLGFVYRDANVIDRDPPPPGSPQVITLEGMSTAMVSASVDVHLTIPRYPDPPGDFVCTPDVEALSARWRSHRAGHEPLLSVAYWISTRLDDIFKGPAATAKALGVSRAILDVLRQISSSHGDDMTARKVVPNAKPLTQAHVEWMERVIPALILRLGRSQTANPMPALTMADFPPLP